MIQIGKIQDRTYYFDKKTKNFYFEVNEINSGLFEEDQILSQLDEDNKNINLFLTADDGQDYLFKKEDIILVSNFYKDL